MLQVDEWMDYNMDGSSSGGDQPVFADFSADILISQLQLQKYIFPGITSTCRICQVLYSPANKKPNQCVEKLRLWVYQPTSDESKQGISRSDTTPRLIRSQGQISDQCNRAVEAGQHLLMSRTRLNPFKRQTLNSSITMSACLVYQEKLRLRLKFLTII